MKKSDLVEAIVSCAESAGAFRDGESSFLHIFAGYLRSDYEAGDADAVKVMDALAGVSGALKGYAERVKKGAVK